MACDIQKKRNGGIKGKARVIQRYSTLKTVDKLSCGGVRRGEQEYGYWGEARLERESNRDE